MESKFHRWWLGSCVAALLLASWAGGFSVAVTAVFVVVYLTGVTLVGPEDTADVGLAAVAESPAEPGPDAAPAVEAHVASETTAADEDAEPYPDDEADAEPPPAAPADAESSYAETTDATDTAAVVVETADPVDTAVIVETPNPVDTAAIVESPDADSAAADTAAVLETTADAETDAETEDAAENGDADAPEPAPA